MMVARLICVACALGCVSLLGLSACAQSSQISVDQQPHTVSTITLGRPQIPSAQHLVEKYEEYLKSIGYEVEVVPVKNSERMSALETSGGVDITFGCMGELYASINPEGAQELSDTVEAEKLSGAELKDITEEALWASLPPYIGVTDPAVISPCDGDIVRSTGTPENLPENFIPIFSESLINREDRIALNYLTGALTPADLEQG